LISTGQYANVVGKIAMKRNAKLQTSKEFSAAAGRAIAPFARFELALSLAMELVHGFSVHPQPLGE